MDQAILRDQRHAARHGNQADLATLRDQRQAARHARHARHANHANHASHAEVEEEQMRPDEAGEAMEVDTAGAGMRRYPICLKKPNIAVAFMPGMLTPSRQIDIISALISTLPSSSKALGTRCFCHVSLVAVPSANVQLKGYVTRF